MNMKARPRVTEATEYGSSASWWVEFPNGLIDLSRSNHLDAVAKPAQAQERTKGQVDVEVDGDRTIRIDARKSALVVIDMQK